jgi:hypothetical protein
MLGLWNVAPASTQSLGSILQQRDESLSFDVACAAGAPDILVVWDETVPTPNGIARGVIRLASAAPGRPPSAVRDVSPADSDAEMPRVVGVKGASFVLWLAHRPETSDLLEASTDLEAPGEAPVYGWLEMVEVDPAGGPLGAVQRLTPTSGHISAYDVQPRADGGRPGVMVVARDDGESVDGAGGTLVRVFARADAIEPARAMVTDGLGRGAPTLLEGAALPWLTWIGPREQPRLLPLGASGVPLAPPSAEDALDEAQPLLMLASQDRMLVATSKDSAAELRVFTCPH